MAVSKNPSLTKNQLAEVICELRFPKILSIDTTVPDAFQEAIRDVFPLYQKKEEQKGNEKAVTHIFITADQKHRITLSNDKIALTSSIYEGWGNFSSLLDKPLVAFIAIYKPAFFGRIGLRYLNFISRQKLSLENYRFSELITPAFSGLLNLPGLDESKTARSTVDCDIALDDNCRVGCHSGTGLVTKAGVNDPEVKYILDFDFYIQSQIPIQLSAGAMQELHEHAFPFFERAVSEKLMDALR